MKKPLIFVFFFTLLTITAFSQELRGTWFARNTLSSKEEIAKAMDSLAANNFNVVYVNTWSRGYPLWQSDVFEKETGMKTDPTYGDRDVLAEVIAEGHRVGIQVEAWFEYGFVGGWTGNQPAGEKGPIFKVHPDWVEQTQDGTELDKSNFYWMVHVNPDVQNFLISMMTELCRDYDIDGIELDRIRYSSLNYGYDNYTDSLYRSEHNGNPPPQNPKDSEWLKWRADKLNQFIANSYDSVKAINPRVNVSNAPSAYSSSSYTSYNDYAQDWVWWVKNNKVDNVQIQSYVGSSDAFGRIIDYVSTLIDDKSKAFPCFAINSIATDEPPRNYIEVTRNKGYGGNSIWYYPDLIPVFPELKATVYSEKTHPPYSPADWREYHKVVEISDSSNIKKFGPWKMSNIIGFNGASLYTNGGDSASVEYSANVPVDGYYEVYAFVVPAINRSENAEYVVYDSSGKTVVKKIDQSKPENRRWQKLGDFYLKKGKQRILKVSNKNVDASKVVGADAMMILLNRRLSPDAVTGINGDLNFDNRIKKDIKLRNYPNPFNGQTKVVFNISNLKPYTLKLYNILGQQLFEVVKQPNSVGEQEVHLDIDNKKLAAGVYLLNFNQADKQESLKIVYAK